MLSKNKKRRNHQYIFRILYAVIRNVFWVAAFFDYCQYEHLHAPPGNAYKYLLFRAPIKVWVRFFVSFLIRLRIGILPRYRSPPLISILPF